MRDLACEFCRILPQFCLPFCQSARLNCPKIILPPALLTPLANHQEFLLGLWHADDDSSSSTGSALPSSASTAKRRDRDESAVKAPDSALSSQKDQGIGAQFPLRPPGWSEWVRHQAGPGSMQLYGPMHHRLLFSGNERGYLSGAPLTVGIDPCRSTVCGVYPKCRDFSCKDVVALEFLTMSDIIPRCFVRNLPARLSLQAAVEMLQPFGTKVPSEPTPRLALSGFENGSVAESRTPSLDSHEATAWPQCTKCR
ncbi:hypothetical protein DFH06DRAFT_1368092 [Mycena polygramma]|nr:hypothetical protein DFH06DRAFT_1368092 [Mycena polygramma]